MSESSKLKQKAEQTVERLETLRDEIKLKAHLGRKEAEDNWAEVEKFLNNLITRVKHFAERVGEESDLQVHLGLMEARDRWDHFEAQLREAIQDVKRQGDKAEGKIDLLRLKAHLARMDSEDFISERREALSKTLEQVKSEVKKHSETVMDDLRKSLEVIAASLPK